MAEKHPFDRNQSMHRIPFRYLTFTLIAVFECVLYLYGWYHLPNDGAVWASGTDSLSIESIDKNGPGERAGLQVGDTILSINHKPVFCYFSITSLDTLSPGSTVQYEILRGGTHHTFSVTFASMFASNASFYWLYYFLIAVVLFIGIFVFVKKPEDASARIFFVFSQVFGICLNSQIDGSGEFGLLRVSIFVFTFPFLGTTLLHFFLLFPQESFQRRRRCFILSLSYAVSLLIGFMLVVLHARLLLRPSESRSGEVMIGMRAALPWMGFTLLTAMGVALKKFFSVREVVTHNQMRWVVAGLAAGLLPETIFGLDPDILWSVEPYFPYVGEFAWAIGSVILLTTFSFALLRYRIWDIEILIKQSFLYGGITLSVTGVYFISVYFVQHFVSAFFISAQTAGVVVSVLLFLPIREMVQRRVDKFFHRENYNATSAAVEFELQLGGIYRRDRLCAEITKQLDGIFHFQAFGFFLRSGKSPYTAVGIHGARELLKESGYAPAEEFTSLLLKEKPFALRELQAKGDELEKAGFEIVVPILYETKPVGFFVCGAKRSEKIYSAEDIRLLSLLARRTSALLRTAELYRSELDRQTLLERERARISKDMHDEVGAALTKISVMSELAEQHAKPLTTRQSLKKISTTARDVSQSLDELVWAMNPRYDSLQDLVSYLREYVVEFCSAARIRCRPDVPDEVRRLAVSAEIRRAIFLVVKEAVNNVVKHSYADEAVFSIRSTASGITIVIKDKGKGIPVKARSTSSNGLRNMKERLNSIGGECVITSSPRRGTEVKLHIPMKREKENTTFV
ncbi:MAG: PDZ domain-containing protein [Bacteroidota bacterium]|nr:PDZ domain-containing protein [Bacteroidota bacterium]